MNPEPAILTSVDQLLQPFEEAFKPPSAFRIGTEAEKFGLLLPERRPVPFEGPRSVAAVLQALAARFEWSPSREHADGDVIALRRGEASITLEPAAQLELSGAPFVTIHETAAEFETHAHELHAVSEPLGIAWLSLGFQPLATHDQLPHAPKLRYRVMRSYLPTRGPRALDMMRRTATVQANLDYSDGDDAMRKLRIALSLQPIVTALCANSPLYEGAARGLLSERADVWLHMDPDRSGMLPFAWERDATLQDYVQWALDVPMFAVKRGGVLVENTGQTFRAFLRDGYAGTRAVMGDWETHLASLFPEARLKRTLEVRGADAQPQAALCAVPALWKGLLYDAGALQHAEAAIAPLSAGLVDAARPDIARRGLRAELAGRSVQRWAQDVLEIASAGLGRIADMDADGRDERHFLAPLERRADAGRTAAEDLLRDSEDSPDPVGAIVAQTRIR